VVFQSLIGVKKVEQGWITSDGSNADFSEAVRVHFDSSKIALEILLEIHLYTHKTTANHSMRAKYRSSIYYFSTEQQNKAISILSKLQKNFNKVLVTTIVPHINFKASRAEIQN
jgi:peptide-methionine (S)-S-oxide reductase